MAKSVKNDKGFLVIEASAREMYVAFGSIGKCDSCACFPESGYYIAVLNRWYCPECYEDWCNRAERHPEDRAIELKNYEFYSKRLKV